MDARPDPVLPSATKDMAAPGAVFTMDNCLQLPDQQRVLAYLNDGGWRFGWKSSSKTDTYMFWHKHFAGYRNGRRERPYDCADELQRNAPMMHAFWLLLARCVFSGHTLTRCYANAQAYGSEGTLHTDSKDPRSYTAIYYPHLAWEPNWAGETVIFNDAKTDIVGSIYPRPNRLVVIPGHRWHAARGVSRTCPELRITLMFKTVHGPVEDHHDEA